MEIKKGKEKKVHTIHTISYRGIPLSRAFSHEEGCEEGRGRGRMKAFVNIKTDGGWGGVVEKRIMLHYTKQFPFQIRNSKLLTLNPLIPALCLHLCARANAFVRRSVDCAPTFGNPPADARSESRGASRED